MKTQRVFKRLWLLKNILKNWWGWRFLDKCSLKSLIDPGKETLLEKLAPHLGNLSQPLKNFHTILWLCFFLYYHLSSYLLTWIYRTLISPHYENPSSKLLAAEVQQKGYKYWKVWRTTENGKKLQHIPIRLFDLNKTTFTNVFLRLIFLSVAKIYKKRSFLVGCVTIWNTIPV